MNITIFGGLNWFGKEMIERNHQSTFYIVDNCSSENSCKTCFDEIKHYDNYEIYYSCITNKDICREVIKKSHIVLFPFLSKSTFMENHTYLGAFVHICLLCREYNVKLVYSVDYHQMNNSYKNSIINEIGCLHSIVYHNSIIIGPMKKRDKIEEMIYFLSIKNHFTVTDKEHNYSTTSQVTDTYIRAIDTNQIEVPYQTINESSILYTIKQKIPKDLFYTLHGKMRQEIVLYDYISSLIHKYFNYNSNNSYTSILN
jgi:hypothetical protein